MRAGSKLAPIRHFSSGNAPTNRGRLKEGHHGRIKHLALADRIAGGRAYFRNQEAAQHRSGPRRGREGLQGRNEERGDPKTRQPAGTARRPYRWRVKRKKKKTP